MPIHHPADAIFLDTPGGPEALACRTTSVAAPGPGEVLIRQTAIGVNFHDIYVRSGLYRTLALPGIPGIEAAGIVEAVGEGVTSLKPGDRVGYVTDQYGAYTTRRTLPAALALPLPTTLEDIPAASCLLKGMTAAVLISRAYRVKPGDTILVHAAAGGVGQLLCRWAKHLGARVIATVGSRDKALTATTAGADHVIFYREEDFVAQTLALTGGNGVSAVYDAVGRDTFAGSLDCLDYLGTLVNYGQASGPIEPISPSALATRSLTLVRPMLFHYLRRPGELAETAGDLFNALSTGFIAPPPPTIFPLSAAGEAHRYLESRAATGSVVLLPE